MKTTPLLSLTCLMVSCGTVPSEFAPANDEIPEESPPVTGLAYPVDGLWYLSSVDDPGQELHLFGEPFRIGSFGFQLSVKDQLTQCVSDNSANTLEDGEDAPTVYKRALGTRPVTMDDVGVLVRFTMDFEPTWHDVFDELHDETTVEFRISGTRVIDATGRNVFDVSVERLFVVSGFSLNGTGTLSHFPVEPWFDCE